MRTLASIQVILALSAIHKADAIEIATVKGWKVVVKKGEFEVGDKVIYCEIDSYLPIKEEYEFLRKTSYAELPGQEGFRLRTIKLRGQVSQGLLLNVSVLPKGEFAVGLDVTTQLGITKYEKPIPKELEGQIKGYRSSIIKRTDEERVQNLNAQWEELRAKGKYFAGEKLDGYSMTDYHIANQTGVCSRDLEFLEGVDNVYTRVAKKYGVGKKLQDLKLDYAVQGELIGLGINGNPYNLPDQDWRIFSIFDIHAYKYLPLKKVREVCATLGLTMVPIVAEDVELPATVEDAIAFADGNSLLNPQQRREGLVWRFLGDEDISFKTISNTHLLNGGE